jgi:hypothetical protein
MQSWEVKRLEVYFRSHGVNALIGSRTLALAISSVCDSVVRAVLGAERNATACTGLTTVGRQEAYESLGNEHEPTRLRLT